MKPLLLTALALLFAIPAFAQTAIPITNPSFENSNTGWTGCLVWAPPASAYPGIPDGKNIGYLNGGKCTQDLGVAAVPSTTYTLKIYIGHRLDGYTTITTVKLLAGTTELCSLAVDSLTIPSGTFASETLSCPVGATAPTGNLTISISAPTLQANFDNLSLTCPCGRPLPPVTLNILTRLVWCTKCDRTDDSPMQGNLIFKQGNVSNSFQLAADGSVNVALVIDMTLDPVTFIVFLTDGNGNAASGSAWTWQFPRASISAGIKTLNTLSFSGVAFTRNADGSVSFAGLL